VGHNLEYSAKKQAGNSNESKVLQKKLISWSWSKNFTLFIKLDGSLTRPQQQSFWILSSSHLRSVQFVQVITLLTFVRDSWLETWTGQVFRGLSYFLRDNAFQHDMNAFFQILSKLPFISPVTRRFYRYALLTYKQTHQVGLFHSVMPTKMISRLHETWYISFSFIWPP